MSEAEDRGPTPETKAKRRPNPIPRLRELGLLGNIEQGAAEEIRAVVEAKLAQYDHSSAGNLEPASGKGLVQFNRAHFDGIPDHLLDIYQRRYIPWAGAMQQLVVGEINVLAATQAIILEGDVIPYLDALLHALRDYANRMK